MGSGLEPYTYGTLDGWLREQGFTVIQQNGSHVTYSDGTRQVAGGCSRAKEHVTTLVAKRVAAAFGHDVRWLREELGYGPGRNGGGRKPLPPPPTKQPTRDVLLKIHKTTRELYTHDRPYTSREHDEICTMSLALTRIKRGQ